jgi:hypothetical protein
VRACTSARSISFCAIWVCIRSSSSSRGRQPAVLPVANNPHSPLTALPLSLSPFALHLSGLLLFTGIRQITRLSRHFRFTRPRPRPRQQRRLERREPERPNSSGTYRNRLRKSSELRGNKPLQARYKHGLRIGLLMLRSRRRCTGCSPASTTLRGKRNSIASASEGSGPRQSCPISSRTTTRSIRPSPQMPPQMWEMKRVHALLAPNFISGLPVRLNEYCRLRQTGRLVRGAGHREAKVSFEYENNGRAQRSSTFDAKQVPPRATTWAPQ